MAARDILEENGGCAGGVIIYNAAKLSARLANLGNSARPLSPLLNCRMKRVFPDVDVDSVRVIENASLPGNWFTPVNDALGMTFGHRIYLKGRITGSETSVRHLIHEMTHVKQIEQLGEEEFACRYGKAQLAAGGDYYQNAFELEADQFADAELPADCVFNGEFRRLTPGWQLTLMNGAADYRKTWTQIVPGSFGMSGPQEDFPATDLFFYDRAAGTGEFYAGRGDGTFKRLASSSSYRKTWDIILPGQFGGGALTDLFFYDRAAGLGRFYAIKADTSMERLSSDDSYRKTWDIIVPGQFGGDGWTDLFFYDRAAGEGEFYRTNGAGGLRRLASDGSYRKTWDIILPGNWGGSGWTDLFFYDRSNGVGELYRTNGAGKSNLLWSDDSFRKTWDIIVPGEFGVGLSNLFFYDRQAGEGEFYLVTAGGLSRLASDDTYRKTWDVILAGQFGFSLDLLSEMFFYTRTT